MLNQLEKEFIIELLAQGKELPEDFKYKLFPTLQKEYELAYAWKMRKEDLFANEDWAFPVPLQIEKIFNGEEHKWFEDGWKNMIVFGDNLQFLKTVYEDKDPTIKGKIKEKVKLIYIDPPFATEEDFASGSWNKAYTDKKKWAEFVEFLRRRLMYAKEILADDGSIFVHLDWKKVHYIKMVMDEVFWEKNFINDVIWYYRRWNIASNIFARNHDVILYYSKNKGSHIFNNLFIPKSEKSSWQWKAWQSFIDEETWKRKSILLETESKWVPMPDVWDISMVNPVAIERKQINYPTQKPEALLERIIKATTNEWDIVLDFFGWSGTTMAVAEKLWRKWITCDLWKLAYFTEQKRILTIQDSKDLLWEKGMYGKRARSFMTCTLGMYDLKNALDLEWEWYKEFVSTLFELDIKQNTIWWFEFDGKKWNSPVKIWDYNKHQNSNVDEDYLHSIHSSVKGRVSRVYIIAPANNIGFISDYYEIDGVKYFFLKIPYQVIKELHKKSFHKIRQPQSKKNVNGLDESVGFHFMKKPEVKSEVMVDESEVHIILNEFTSQYYKDEEGKILWNFETLSAIFIDKNFNGTQFMMTDVKFADELLPKKKSKEKAEDENIEASDDEIRGELKELSGKWLTISMDKSGIWEKIMVVYTDIYGNDFSEILTIK